MGTKDFSTLIQDINYLFKGKDLSERIHHLTKELGDTFIKRFSEYAADRKPELYLSNVGKPSRQLWYDIKGFKGEALTPDTLRKFLYGSVLESLVIFLAKEAGHSVTGEQQRVEVDGVRGKIDGVFDEEVLCDVKSCSTRSFEKFQKRTLFQDDPFGYVGQLSGYKQALKINRAAFIAIDKVTGKICVLELPPEVSNSYNVSLKIKEQREMLARNTPPERCYSPQPVSKKDKTGNLILGTGCSYCAHKIECWKDSNDGKGLQIRYYSAGPKWFTTIKQEPRLKSDTDYEEFSSKDTV